MAAHKTSAIVGKAGPMAIDGPRAELSSLSSTLEEVTARVAEMADTAADDDQALASELFEVERGLQAAMRRLAKLVGDLP